MIKAVFFDLDGTLLPVDEDQFVQIYFQLLYQKLKPYGYLKDQLINCIWNCVKKMMNNDGQQTNETLFWNDFALTFGQDKLKDKEYIQSFYTHEFKQLKSICQDHQEAKEIVQFCKEKNLLVILATNPLFPKDGICTRMEFVGLKESDFDYITSYENSYHSKPQSLYYRDILEKYQLKGEEVLMFGNNEYEDGVATLENIQVYMTGEYVIADEHHRFLLPYVPFSNIKDVILKHLDD